jgi:hypothetical protein
VKRLGLLLGCALAIAATTAEAEVSTDQPGSILIFPKIASDQTQDTIIQVSNAAGVQIFARCFYINGALDEASGQPLWSVTDFQITLTHQQPAVWVASQGLPTQPPDRPKDLYPGPIPPVSVGFLGELRCVVVTDNEEPTSRNVLTGEATVIDRITHATRKYQGITVPGLPGNNGDNTLLLNDVEYSTCPRVLLFNHFFNGAPDPVLNTAIESSLTFVPCSMDLEHSVAGTATLQFNVVNEFELRSSASISVTCFADVNLSDISQTIFNFALQGTMVGQTRIRSVVDADTTHGHGVLAIAEEFRDSGQTGVALNLHFIGGSLQSDVLVLPSTF